MQQAWEYEKEGMGLQYNYGQQTADAEYKRNLQMWKDTNFGAQRAEMEDAGLSVGLMYGNGGGQAASTAGGSPTPNKRHIYTFYHQFFAIVWAFPMPFYIINKRL